MAETRLVVFIGPMKTGSTALALFLTSWARAGRLPEWFWYPLEDAGLSNERGIVKHHRIEHLALIPKRKRYFQSRGLLDVEGIRKSIAALAAAARASELPRVTVFLIAESARQSVDPGRFAQELRAHFDEVVFCQVARQQQYALPSMHAHAIRSWDSSRGSSVDHRQFLELSNQSVRLDHFAATRRWNTATRTRVVTVPYLEVEKGGHGLIQRIFERLAIGLELPQEIPEIDGRLINRSAGLSTLEGLARIKRERGPAGASSEEFRDVFVEQIRAGKRTRAEAWALDEEATAEVLAHYRESNRRFRAELGAEAEEPVWREWFAGVGLDPVEPEKTRLNSA